MEVDVVPEFEKQRVKEIVGEKRTEMIQESARYVVQQEVEDQAQEKNRSNIGELRKILRKYFEDKTFKAVLEKFYKMKKFRHIKKDPYEKIIAFPDY